MLPEAVITGAAAASGGGATADPDNYQVNIPSSATATIEKAASSITINDAEWPGTKTYGDPDFPLTGVTTVGDGAVTKTSDSANVLTVDLQRWSGNDPWRRYGKCNDSYGKWYQLHDR